MNWPLSFGYLHVIKTNSQGSSPTRKKSWDLISYFLGHLCIARLLASKHYKKRHFRQCIRESPKLFNDSNHHVINMLQQVCGRKSLMTPKLQSPNVLHPRRQLSRQNVPLQRCKKWTCVIEDRGIRLLVTQKTHRQR